MKKLLNIFLLFILLNCLSCKTPNFIQTNLFYSNCNIKGGEIDTINPKIPDYVADGIKKATEMEYEYEIVYYYDFINGEPSDGVSVCFINQDFFKLNQIEYNFSYEKEREWEMIVEPKIILKKEKKFIQKILNDIDEFKWGVEITCIDMMYESYGMLYIKRNGEFLYYVKLQDCEFTEMHSLGLTTEIIQMINILAN